jgi:hypothetical protein
MEVKSLKKKAINQLNMEEIIEKDIVYLVKNKIITSHGETEIKKEIRRFLISKIEKAVDDKDWEKCSKYIRYCQKFEPAYIPYEHLKKSEYQILLEDMAYAYAVRHETFLICEYMKCLNELYELGFVLEGGTLFAYNADTKEEAFSIAEKASSIMKKYFCPDGSDIFKLNLDESIYIFRFTQKKGMFWKDNKYVVLTLEQLRRQPEELE